MPVPTSCQLPPSQRIIHTDDTHVTGARDPQPPTVSKRPASALDIFIVVLEQQNKRMVKAIRRLDEDPVYTWEKED